MSRQVNNLNQRGCAFSIVLHDSGADVFKSSNYILHQIMCDEKDVIFCAVILHTKDWLEEENRFKHPHYHVVITFGGSYRVQTIINWLSELFHANINQIGCEKCNSVSMQVRYLIHLDDFDKYQYKEYEIETNNKDVVHRYMMEIKKIVDVNDLFVIMNEYKNLKELIRVIGLENYRKYRSVILDVRKEGLY